MDAHMAKSFSAESSAETPNPDTARERILDRARDPGNPERSSALIALAHEAARSAPWTEGYAMPVTISIPKTLADVILTFVAAYVGAEKPNPKKSEIFATAMRNGVSLLIEHVTSENSPHEEG
jgi:hypothetical protein